MVMSGKRNHDEVDDEDEVDEDETSIQITQEHHDKY